MIQIINTGVANIRSLQAAFDRLDLTWNLTVSAEEITNATDPAIDLSSENHHLLVLPNFRPTKSAMPSPAAIVDMALFN